MSTHLFKNETAAALFTFISWKLKYRRANQPFGLQVTLKTIFLKTIDITLATMHFPVASFGSPACRLLLSGDKHSPCFQCTVT